MVFYLRAVSLLVSRLQSTGLRRSNSRAVLLLLCALALSFAPLQAQQMQVLTKHVRAAVTDHRAAFYGAMPAEQRIHASIVLPVRNPDQLKSLLGRLYDPASPDYRHFLSVAQFTEQFGPTDADFQTVVAFARANGLNVGDLPANRMVVPIEGTAAQMGAAFNVKMNLYQHPTENRTFFSPDREPSLNLKVQVSHIAGLDSYSLPQHMSLQKPAGATTATANGTVVGNAQQAATVNGSGPGGSYLGSDMRAAYYGGSTLDGNGQVIGILEFGGYSMSDVDLSFGNAGQSYQVPIVNVLLDGATGANTGTDGEQVLDIVQAIGMAPGLSQVRVYIGQGLDDPNILNSMASENLAKQLSCSWGWRPADPTVDDVFFQEMAAQGQSFFTASGDSGAYDAAINPFFYPADDAYVTAVGGTHLTTTAPGGSWVSESVWNSGGAGSGGGISQDNIALPSWQAGLANSANGGSNTLRNVPDVAMEGDFDNYACQNGACNGGWAGTSFAAPRWAAFMALINQQAVEAGNAPNGGLGFVNPAIYQLAQGANSPADFHDVTVGNNQTKNQPLWFSAVPGYDLATGWGSATGQHLIDDLAGTQVPGFWLGSLLRTVTVNPGSTATTTVAITPAGGFGGSVTLAVASALPSGVTASFSPNPATASSVLTLTATSAAPTASQTVTLTGTSDQLTASTNITVAVHAPSFALSATPTTVGINQGATGTTTIAVQDLYGFAGAVNLSIAGLPAGVTAAFSPTSTSGSSALTLTVASTAVPGNTTLTVTGTSGSLTSTANVTLSIHGPSFTLSTQATVAVGQGSTASTYVSVLDQYGFTGSVNLAVTGLPAGVTASFSPNPTSGSSYLTLTASSSAALGQSVLTITGTSGQLSATTTLTLGVYAPSFTIYTGGSVGVGQGSSASTYISVTGLYGFTGSVNLSFSGLPTGVTATISPNPTTSSSTITFVASSSAPIGQSVVTITGTSGSITTTATINLGVYAPTFTLSNGGLSGLGQGKSITTTIYVNDQYGFTGLVNLAVSGLPSGVTASFSPSSTTGSSTLTLTASSTATIGQSTLVVTGTSGSISATTTLGLGVYAPTFTLSSSGAVSIGQGKSATASVYVYDLYGFNGPVNFTVSGLPSGVTASFSPNPTTSTYSGVTFTASGNTPLGQSTVTVTGTSGSVSVSTTLNLSVYVPTFALTGPGSITVGQGNSSTASIGVYSEYGFNSSVALSIAGLPSGLTALWTPNPTTTSSSLILAATSAVKTGVYNLIITGVSGGQSATTSLAVSVFTPTFTLSASSAVSLGQGSTTTAYVYVSTLYGFTGSVNLSLSGLPSGVTASFSTNPTTYSSTLTLTASSSAAIGQTALTLTGTSGGQTVTAPITLNIYAPTFTLSGGGSLTLGQGGSASSYFYVGSQYGFSGNVTMSVSGLPTGVTASFSPNPTTYNSTLILTAASSAPAGVYALTITGTSGSQTAVTTLTLTVATPSFTLYNSSSTVTLGQGGTGSTYLYLNQVNGFTGSVTMSVSGLPAGVTASFSPNPTTYSSTLTLTASSSAAIGQYTLTVTGVSGSLSSTTTVPLSILAPSFTLSGSTAVAAGQGGTAYDYLYINTTSGFTGNVTFTVSGLPSGVTGTFSQNPTTYSTSLNLVVGASVPVGTSTVTVTGTSGSLSATSTFQLTIYPPSFTLNDSYSTLSLNQGGSTTDYMYVYGQNGFSGNVTFTASGLPSGVTASFSPNPTTYSTNLVLNATSAATPGISTITITGTSGSASASIPITLTITTPSFTITASPSTALLTPGSSQSATLTPVPLNGFAGSVSYTATGLPSGVTASFSPNPTTGVSTLTLTASTTAAPVSGMVTVTGTSGSLSASTVIAVTVGSPATSTSTTLALTASGSPVTTVASGTLVTATASVAAGSTPLTNGLVNLCDTLATTCDAAHLVGSAQITSAGTAVFVFIAGPGAHHYKAFFNGTRAYAASLSSQSYLPVTASLPTATTIAQSGSAGKYTLTATVTGQGPIAPSGYVSYLDTTDGNYSFASAALGVGTATFSMATPQTPTVGTTPEAVVAGDFNGDGIADLATANTGSNNLTIQLGNGDGTFRTGSTLPTGAGPDSVVAGDFNRDGKLDLAIASSSSGGVNVYLGNGDGTFTPSSLSPQTGSSPVSLVAGDFNGDGIADLAVVNSNSSTLTILLGNGDGSFTPTANSPAVGNYPRGIALGDFNRDGVQDLAVTNPNTNTISILFGVGDGTFGTGGTITAGYYPASIVAGDLNGDGKLDLAVGGQYGSNAIILLGNGDGTFTLGTSPVTGSYPLSIVLGDFNGDGKVDIATANEYGNNATVLLGNGDGTFATGISVAAGGYPVALVAGDWNGDGIKDLAIANSNSASLTILTSQLAQKATAIATNVAPLGQGLHAVDASYQGDTVYVGSTSTTTTLTAGSGAPNVSLSLSSPTISEAQTLTVTITVSGGSANPVPTGSVTFTGGGATTAPATLSGGSAAITLPAGTFPVGTDFIYASYTPDAASTSLYTVSYGVSAVTVTKATPILTWAAPAPITFGTALSAVQLNATASVPGSFVYTPGLGAVPALGSQLLQVVFTPTDTTNYTTATASVTLTVNPGYGVWIGNGNGTVSGLTQAGTAITPVALAAGGQGVAVDALGDVWSITASAGTLAEFAKGGSLIYSGFSGGGLSRPTALAIDGSGVIWIANGNNSVSAFSSAGIPLSTTAYGVSIPTPTSIDVDGSGNLWITNAGDNSVTQMIGIATPVVTPTTTAVKNGTLAAKP